MAARRRRVDASVAAPASRRTLFSSDRTIGVDVWFTVFSFLKEDDLLDSCFCINRHFRQMLQDSTRSNRFWDLRWTAHSFHWSTPVPLAVLLRRLAQNKASEPPPATPKLTAKKTNRPKKKKEKAIRKASESKEERSGSENKEQRSGSESTEERLGSESNEEAQLPLKTPDLKSVSGKPASIMLHRSLQSIRKSWASQSSSKCWLVNADVLRTPLIQKKRRSKSTKKPSGKKSKGMKPIGLSAVAVFEGQQTNLATTVFAESLDAPNCLAVLDVNEQKVLCRQALPGSSDGNVLSGVAPFISDHQFLLLQEEGVFLADSQKKTLENLAFTTAALKYTCLPTYTSAMCRSAGRFTPLGHENHNLEVGGQPWFYTLLDNETLEVVHEAHEDNPVGQGQMTCARLVSEPSRQRILAVTCRSGSLYSLHLHDLRTRTSVPGMDMLIKTFGNREPDLHSFDVRDHHLLVGLDSVVCLYDLRRLDGENSVTSRHATCPREGFCPTTKFTSASLHNATSTFFLTQEAAPTRYLPKPLYSYEFPLVFTSVDGAAVDGADKGDDTWRKSRLRLEPPSAPAPTVPTRSYFFLPLVLRPLHVLDDCLVRVSSESDSLLVHRF